MGVGIHALATVGHHEENLANSRDAPWQRIPGGAESRGVDCPAQEALLDYAESNGLTQRNEVDGEPGGDRTRDPQIKSLMLYQLSYRP